MEITYTIHDSIVKGNTFDVSFTGEKAKMLIDEIKNHTVLHVYDKQYIPDLGITIIEIEEGRE